MCQVTKLKLFNFYHKEVLLVYLMGILKHILVIALDFSIIGLKWGWWTGFLSVPTNSNILSCHIWLENSKNSPNLKWLERYQPREEAPCKRMWSSGACGSLDICMDFLVFKHSIFDYFIVLPKQNISVAPYTFSLKSW